MFDGFSYRLGARLHFGRWSGNKKVYPGFLIKINVWVSAERINAYAQVTDSRLTGFLKAT